VIVDARQDQPVPFDGISPFQDTRRAGMHRPSAQEFLQALLETLDDLPADLARRFEEVLKNGGADRSQVIRQLFEEFAGD
jgi:hypothetical protein